MSDIQDLKNYILAMDKKINDMMQLIHRIVDNDVKINAAFNIIHNEAFERAKNNNILFQTIYPDFASRLAHLEGIFREVKRNEIDKEIILKKPIHDTDLTSRTINSLRSYGIKTIEELVKNTSYELMRIPNFGRRSLYDVKESLDKLNLKIKDMDKFIS